MSKKIKIFGIAEPGALEQAERCMKKASHIALMADNHKGFGVPIGAVALYKDAVPPAGVGFDIGCGNKAVKLDIKYKDIKDQEELADKIWSTISFGTGQKNNVLVEKGNTVYGLLGKIRIGRQKKDWNEFFLITVAIRSYDIARPQRPLSFNLHSSIESALLFF